jgi:WD40 repeat protein
VEVCLQGHDYEVNDLAFSPDGTHLLSSSSDRTARLWDIGRGAELACLRGHQRAVHGVAFFGDGRRALSASFDRTVRVWDTVSGAELHCLRGHPSEVRWVAVGANGTRIVSQSVDHEIRVWDVSSGACVTVIPGYGDIEAIASGPDRYPWRAIAHELETVIKPITGEPVAWFPEALSWIVTHRSGRTWAAKSGSHVYLIRLCGEP